MLCGLISPCTTPATWCSQFRPVISLRASSWYEAGPWTGSNIVAVTGWRVRAILAWSSMYVAREVGTADITSAPSSAW